MIGETRFSVTARLDENGEASVKVFGRCSYGEGEQARDATESMDMVDEAIVAKVQKALTAAVTEIRDALNRQTMKATAKCLSVAAENGEIG